MQDEINEKVVALVIKGGKLTAELLQKAMKAALAEMKKQLTEQQNKLHSGKQSLKQLKAHGATLSNMEITKENIGAFTKTAREFQIDFALKKDSTRQPPMHYVFFKAPEIDNITAAFEKFSREKLQRDKKPSIRKALSVFKEAAKQRNADRQQTKHKTRGLER